METVNDSGWLGALKRFEYSRIFRTRGKTLQGVLTTGYRTVDWVVAHGMPCDKVYPFAYFLPNKTVPITQDQRKPGPPRIIFVGRLIPLKRVDWLINALADLTDQSFELWVVGAGLEERELKVLAESKLENRVHWLGQLSLPDVPAVMAQTDCLVLPSVHDGWGAVASEALMVGTPVICRDACGVAGVVRASGAGGVFAVNDRSALRDSLAAQLAKGVVQLDERHRIAEWATCLGADEGARYLLDILMHIKNTANGVRPAAPWKRDLI
jgi:glycosyltransferase involved in cell wall biosynthesis